MLYSYFRSSASWRVRIVLALKGLDYEYRAVNLIKDGGEQKKEEYVKSKNPMGQVPTYVDGDMVLTQSVAIMEYLEEKYPEVSLMPKDLAGRAKVRQLVEVVNSGTQPIQNLSVMLKAGGTAEERREWMRFWIDRGLTAFEALLQSTSGKYCVGDEVTLADCCIVPQLLNANRNNVDMSKFPTINRISAELANHEAFKKAHPDNQPDCPP